MSYQAIVRPTAEKFILRLREADYRAILDQLRALRQEPRPHSASRLAAVELWRLRVRDYRIIYAISDKEKTVRVVRITRRSEDTYKGL